MSFFSWAVFHVLSMQQRQVVYCSSVPLSETCRWAKETSKQHRKKNNGPVGYLQSSACSDQRWQQLLEDMLRTVLPVQN